MSGTQVNAFEHFRAAWYGEHHFENDVFDEVRFGRYPKNGGPASHAISVRWHAEAASGAARLWVDSGDWPLLYDYREVLHELASISNRPITPADVIDVLTEHSFEDRTEVTDTAPLIDLLEQN